jgi:hypothetical protein
MLLDWPSALLSRAPQDKPPLKVCGADRTKGAGIVSRLVTAFVPREAGVVAVIVMVGLIDPVDVTVNEHGAVPAAELWIDTAVQVTVLPSVETVPVVVVSLMPNVPTLMLATAVAESVNEAPTPVPTRPTTSPKAARSPAIFRRDMFSSYLLVERGEWE